MEWVGLVWYCGLLSKPFDFSFFFFTYLVIMADNQVRQLNESGENRFKYASFNERIKKVKIRIKQTNDETACYFIDGLEKWSTLNCTAQFSDFYGKVAYSTLEQVLHHKNEITDNIIQALIPDSLCLESLLDLTVLLAKDLQDDFDTLRVLERIASLISTEKDPIALEHLYNCVAHLFKVQANTVTAENVFKIFKHQLYDKKAHIRTFAAQCLAFLFRKSSCEYEFIIKDLSSRECQEYCEGQALLFFEIIKALYLD